MEKRQEQRALQHTEEVTIHRLSEDEALVAALVKDVSLVLHDKEADRDLVGLATPLGQPADALLDILQQLQLLADGYVDL